MEPVLAFALRTALRDVVVLRRRDGIGTYECLTLVLERQSSRGITGVSHVEGLDGAGLRALHDRIRRASHGQAGPVAVDLAVRRVVRALLVDRLHRRPDPAPLDGDPTWLRPWERALGGLRDLVTCAVCEGGLPGSWQRAIARGEVTPDGPVRCPDCGGLLDDTPLADLVPLPRAVACAELLVAAGEPRHALTLVARAVQEGVAADALAGIRGAAHLALGNAVQAAVHLRHALAARPGDLRWRALLVEADLRCGLVASAAGHLDAIADARPDAAALARSIRASLPALEGGAEADAFELRCLQALAFLDAGRPEEARLVLDLAQDALERHPVRELVAGALQGTSTVALTRIGPADGAVHAARELREALAA